MIATAAIAARFPTCPGDVVVSGEKSRFGRQRLNRAQALRVEVRHLGRVMPGINVSRASPLWFRLAALPEDDGAAEATEAVVEPAVGAPTYEGPTVKVKFELQRECHFGQQFKVVGGDSQFGDWEPSAAAPLNWSEGHVWTAEVDVPEGKRLEYKYVLIGQEGEVEWQPGSNLVLETAAGAEPLIISDAWEETQPEPTAELEVQPAEPEVPPTKPEVPPTKLEVPPTKLEVPPTKFEVPPTKLEMPPTKLEVPPAEPEVPSAESDTGDWETYNGDAEVNTPADALADVAASAAVGALNAGVKAAHAIEGGLDAISPVSDSPSSEANGVAESKEEETSTAIEIPVVDAALAATAEPAAPAEEPLNTNNGASSSQAESAITAEKLSIEESSMEAQPTRIEEQPTIEEPKKRLNPFQKDIEWLSKTFFGR